MAKLKDTASDFRNHYSKITQNFRNLLLQTERFKWYEKL